MGVTFAIEGLEDLVANMGELPKATQRNTGKRILTRRAQPVADAAAQLAPERSGRLAFSISVSSTLTRRQRGAKESEVEVYIGPAGGNGALNYASLEEFGSIHNIAHGFMRTAWDSHQAGVLDGIGADLWAEVVKATDRIARKAARLGG